MSEAPESKRPAARTRTATYFILSSPRYVRFPGLVFWRPGVSEYTPGPSLSSRSLGFFLIEVIRRKEFGKAVSLLLVQFRAMDCKKIAGNAPRSSKGRRLGVYFIKPREPKNGNSGLIRSEEGITCFETQPVCF